MRQQDYGRTPRKTQLGIDLAFTFPNRRLSRSLSLSLFSFLLSLFLSPSSLLCMPCRAADVLERMRRSVVGRVVVLVRRWQVWVGWGMGSGDLVSVRTKLPSCLRCDVGH